MELVMDAEALAGPEGRFVLAPPASTNLIAGRTPKVTIVVLPYGFVLATQIKDRL